jgi:hypothetical protein
MRIWAQGIDERKPRQPVIVLEAGSGADLDTWRPIFSEVAKIAPVVAYDRLRIGQSAADPKTPTLTRNVETLRDMLHAIASPPYDRLRGDGAELVRLQIKHQSEWTLSSPNSLFTIAGHTGHKAHRDDPGLVIATIRHVFDRVKK